MSEPDPRTPVERALERSVIDDEGAGAPLRRTSVQRQRTVEGYLKGQDPPRWMQRAAQIDRGIGAERERLAAARERLRERCGADRELFTRRWRELVQRWRFDDHLNQLIETHNEWYPVERRLPVNPRTGEYVLLHGRSYRRPVLDAAWALEQFPDETA